MLAQLQQKANRAMYKPNKFSTLQKWSDTARHLRDEMEYSKKLTGDYLDLNRPIVLN